MISGTAQFTCDECGNKFESWAVEYLFTAIISPARCPQCGSHHTYPATGMGALPGKKAYGDIWKSIDEQNAKPV